MWCWHNGIRRIPENIFKKKNIQHGTYRAIFSFTDVRTAGMCLWTASGKREFERMFWFFVWIFENYWWRCAQLDPFVFQRNWALSGTNTISNWRLPVWRRHTNHDHFQSLSENLNICEKIIAQPKQIRLENRPRDDWADGWQLGIFRSISIHNTYPCDGTKSACVRAMWLSVYRIESNRIVSMVLGTRPAVHV